MLSADQAETHRLVALRALKVLDTPRENPFDRLVFVAAQAFRVPMAAMALVDADRQWFKAQVGLPMQQTPRSQTLGSQAIQSDAPLVVENAPADERFRGDPLVAEAPFIRFYAGAPLVGPGGFRVGSLCVLDRVARSPSTDQVRLLARLAEEASELLMARVVDDGTIRDWLGYASAF